VALEQWKHREDLTLEDVVDAAESLLREVAPRQTRYAVADRPDVRTVRYYTTRGLLPKPLSYDGGRARYGYAHLVRLLAIKKLQADHFTLDQIARALAHKSDDAVESLIARTSTFDHVQQPRALDEVPRPRALDRPHEFEPAPGVKIVVDADVMNDRHARERLAHNLEDMARLLRATGGDRG
jgi:DNA-binding transcriptional MerR regulator